MTPATLRLLETVVCTRKVAMGRGAAMAVGTKARRNGQQMSAYRCPFSMDPTCHWHVGHPPSMKTLKRIAEMLRDRHAGTVPVP